MTRVGTVEYGSFSERIFGKTFGAGIPSHGHFELTFACPLKCGFCYCSCYTSPEHLRMELSTQEVLRIIDEAADGGCLWMTFSGGDPFVRRDFREIYDHAYGRGIIVSIFCSGLIMTDDWLARLQETKPLKIELPFYGVTAETYEAVSGRKGSFERALGNIRRMVSAGLPVKLKTKITRKNLAEAAAVKRFLAEELGMEFHPNYNLYPKLDGSREHLADRLSPRQASDFEVEFSVDACESGTESQSSDPANPNLFRCAAGVNSFYINPYGELNFCTYVREDSYDLKHGTIREGVEKLRRSLLSRTRKPDAPCTSCSIQASCNNCPGSAVLETGSMEGRSDYLCEVNHSVRGKEWRG